MKRRADRKLDPNVEREKLIGLGKRSISKSYYPELRNRLDELEHFRALLDSVSDAILIVDADSGRILDISGSTQVMLGCGIDALRGIEFRKLLPEHIAKYSKNLFSGKNDLISLETTFQCPGNALFIPVPVEMTMRIVELKGARQGIIVARNITERKLSEEALKKSHDELEIRVRERTRELHLANRAKSEFLSIVSHELRTPLTSVLGFTKIIRKKLLNVIFPALRSRDQELNQAIARIKKNIDIIESEGDRLTALINDVLDLAKLESNKIDYRMEPLNPKDFIGRAIQATTPLFEDTGLMLVADIDPDLPQVQGDRDRLIQVMVNLISNAVKFTDKGSVTCQARLVGDHLKVSVIDTGIGIPRDMLASVFDKFTQVNETLTDRPRGTGLGLPICRHIVDGHGGHVWVESEEGKGSRFMFTLPVSTE